MRASRTIKVNADSREPTLTRSLVWRGLMMKAENPLPFVPVITSCKVIERRADRQGAVFVLDDFVEDGAQHTARHALEFDHAFRMVMFPLKFTFTLAVEGMADGSAEEREFAGQMEQGYLMAVAATLKAMRIFAKDNALSAAS